MITTGGTAINEKHFHYCVHCYVDVECWYWCGVELVDGKLLSGGVVCNDCEAKGLKYEDA